MTAADTIGISMIEVSRQKEEQSERKQSVFRIKGAQTTVALSNGLYAVAAIAVTLARGNRQAIPDNYLAGIGILNLDKELVLINITGK